jgi:ABC-type transport system involved in cytochrome bd biosynthesis fused ATPase/permease subunit
VAGSSVFVVVVRCGVSVVLTHADTCSDGALLFPVAENALAARIKRHAVCDTDIFSEEAQIERGFADREHDAVVDTHFLRDNIGMVLQKNHIFDGTIEENIRYGRPNATQEEVMEAAKKAYIYDQIMKLPNGFQSRAQQLSGGQQQRIAIARMFLKNPPIIFLDEPTASLDAIATEQIKASIDAIKKDRTVIIISHSISQIIDSDVIYALKEGRVEQSGNPDELYQQGGIYKEIVDASARSLNIDKLAQTLDTNGDGILFN